MKNGQKYAELIKYMSQLKGFEQGAVVGYDLMMGIEKGDHEKRYKAWTRYIEEMKKSESHSDEYRDGAWVPAIMFE